MRSTICSALLVALVASSSAFGAPPDAPTLPPARALHKGDLAPEDGVFMTVAKAQDVAIKCKAAQLERDNLKKLVEDDTSPTKVLITVSVVSLVVGFLAGATVIAIKR